MVRKTKDDGDTAVMERTGNPDDIAAKVAAADANARKAQALADVHEWRRVVSDIANGLEPDGKGLASIADLARRLRLPADAVARSVKAMQDERRLQGEADETKQRLVAITDREAELNREIRAAQARLLELNTELAEYVGLHRGYPYKAMAVAAVRSENPLMFADAGIVADRLIAAEAGIGTAVFKAMEPQ